MICQYRLGTNARESSTGKNSGWFSQGQRAWTDRFRVAPPSQQRHGPHTLLLGNPALSSAPNVTHLDPPAPQPPAGRAGAAGGGGAGGGITVTWVVYLSTNHTAAAAAAAGRAQFAVEASFTLLPGADAIKERTVVRRLQRSASGGKKTHIFCDAIVY